MPGGASAPIPPVVGNNHAPGGASAPIPPLVGGGHAPGGYGGGHAPVVLFLGLRRCGVRAVLESVLWGWRRAFRAAVVFSSGWEEPVGESFGRFVADPFVYGEGIDARTLDVVVARQR